MSIIVASILRRLRRVQHALSSYNHGLRISEARHGGDEQQVLHSAAVTSSRRWRAKTHLMILVICFLLVFARSVYTSSWGLDLHHDYFSVGAGQYFNMGLAPNRESYTHYGPVDALVKSVMLRMNEGRLVGAKQLTAVMDATAAITLSILLMGPGWRSRRFLLTAVILWLGWEPFAFPSPDKFDGILRFMAEWMGKIPKLAWSSDIALVFTCFLILITTGLILQLDRLDIESSKSEKLNFIFLASATGGLTALTFFTKISIGLSMALAVFASLISACLIVGKRGLICVAASICLIASMATTGYVLLGIVGIEGVDKYVQQVLTGNVKFFSAGNGSLGLVSKALMAAQGWALNANGMSLLIGCMTAWVMITRFNQDLISRTRITLFGFVIASAWSFQAAFRLMSYTINAISSAAFAAFALSIIVSPSFFPRWRKLDKKLQIRLSTLGWFSLFSLTQIMPAYDSTHVWWAVLPLLLFVTVCSEELMPNGIEKYFIRAIIAGFAISGVFCSTAAALSVRPDFVQITDPSFLTGIRYNQVYGRQRAEYALSAQHWLRENPEGAVLSMTVQEPLLDLLSANELSADLQRCLGGPYFIITEEQKKSNCLKEILVSSKNSILLAASDPKEIPANLQGIQVEKVFVDGNQFGRVVFAKHHKNI